jgi:hypothetical protein
VAGWESQPPVRPFLLIPRDYYNLNVIICQQYLYFFVSTVIISVTRLIVFSLCVTEATGIMNFMLRWTLNSLIGELEDKTKEKFSLVRVSKEANLSYPAIHRLSQGKLERVETQTLDKLLQFFNKYLDRRVTVDDLLHYED